MGKKIMFVDDEPDQLFAYEQSLLDLNPEYEFIGVGSGEECLEKLENSEIPDVIFLDILMPEMSGLELYSQIKNQADWRKIPIVFLTAQPSSDAIHWENLLHEKDKEYINEDELFDELYIEKPIEIEKIMKKIEEITSSENNY